jgi:predicted N-acetyltransferase YhbS
VIGPTVGGDHKRVIRLTGREDYASRAVVRPASLADRGAIRQILRHLHPERADRATLPCVRQEAQTFVATDGERVVGMIVATLVDYGVEAYGMIDELVVEEECRGLGIGAALLDRGRTWLEASGAEVVFVSALDEEVAEFYIATGFTRCLGPWLFWAPD